MSMRFSRRHFLTAVTAGLGLPAWARAPETSLRPVMRPDGFLKQTATGAKALISQAKLGGKVAFSVVDVKTGKVLEENNGSAELPPASVTKSVTALYALAALGGNHRFTTRILATGGVSNGVVKGDLILAGGGDPTLDTNALAALAARLKSAGIREVRGKLRPWGGALPSAREIDSDQPDHVAYNPTVSGLNLNFNRVHFEWKRSGGGYSTTMDARSDKYRPSVRSARISIASGNGPVYTYRDQGTHDAWTVAQKALGKGGARWLPHRKPEAYAAEIFAVLARAHGIVLKLGSPLNTLPGGSTVATVSSAPLRDILRDMLKYSNNLTAEVVGLSATAARKGKAKSLRSSAQEMTSWARQSLGMNGARFVDHSGLGAASRVSASAMARAMAKVYRDGALKPLLKPISMRNEAGKVDKSHPIKVTAKTGTLYFVSTLSGYMTARDGTELAFAIFTVNDKLRAGINRQSDARPEGSRGWNKRSKRLQQKLIERWGQVYGS